MPDQVDWRTMEREATPGRAVGRLLRDQREARGLTVGDVEKRLRIRRHYLEAIEQGRFDLLPGATYIPAFLRAYAKHLGLDPEKVLTAYNLSGPVPIERPIALPADFPLVERRAPIGLAVLTVLLVIGAGYAAWHYLPRQQAVVAEKVPPVPDRLLAARPATPPATNEHANTGATAAAATTAAPVTPPATQTQEVRSAPGTLPQETWPAPKHDSASAPLSPPVVVAVPVAPPPVVMSVPGIGQAQAAQPTTVDPQRVDSQRLAAPSTADTQEAVARGATPDSTANAPAALPSLPMKADTQLLVRSNSWIELRAPNGDVLAQTYVRAGESYVVPAGIAYRIIDAR
ncbi:MAG: helix-turn-helix domain-containing protein [Reyranellales bacterium]